ncbi:MAG: hypothetical protein ACD_21C00063G0002 [uncultured bacterium]|nr:MAG: hypothetical protein ACD_21C00063G0002 [uncultured bacterium]
MLREHPGILRRTIELAQKAEAAYEPANMEIGEYELHWDKRGGGKLLNKLVEAYQHQKPLRSS